MSGLLSSRQAEELHKSIIAYLSTNNLPNAATALRAELNLREDDFDAKTEKKYETLLEKKWTTIVRLQKKILDLESKNAALQSELDSVTPTSLSGRHQDPTTWLPRSPPRHTLESHRGTINCVAFHPIFSSIASGSDDCTIKIWDWEVGDLECTLKGHTRAVLGVDYGGPRGATLLASCSSDLTVRLWDPAAEYKNVRVLVGHDHSVSAVRFIPSGDAAAPTSGNLLVSTGRDMALLLWDVTTGFCVKKLQGHTGWVRGVCPSFDGRFLFSTGDDRTARLWDLSSANPGDSTTMFGHEHFNECCAIAPPATYQYLTTLSGLKNPPSPQNAAEFMATGSRDKTIKLWNARGICIKTLVGHQNWVRALVFHPGGKYLLSVSDDKTLRCWDLSQEGYVKDLFTTPGDISAAQGELSKGMLSSGERRAGYADTRIRCVISTGCADGKLRIFAG